MHDFVLKAYFRAIETPGCRHDRLQDRKGAAALPNRGLLEILRLIVAILS
jgi:hypothetical protein